MFGYSEQLKSQVQKKPVKRDRHKNIALSSQNALNSVRTNL